MSYKIYFTKDECYCNFKSFYNKVIKKLEGTPYEIDTQIFKFNYNKIKASYWLLKRIFDYYYYEMDADYYEIMRYFMMYSPKNITDTDGWFIELEDDDWAIVKKEENHD